MLKHLGIFALLLTFSLFFTGCGGSGDSEASSPNGTFTLGFNPDADGGIAHAMGIEIEAEGGEIISGFAHFIDNELSGYSTDDVTGTASSGVIEATCDFGFFDVHINAVYSGLQWHGTYQVVKGTKVIEEGDLTISRTGAETPDIAAFWEGSITDGGVDFEMDILQKGNYLEVDAEIDGVLYVGGGTVVGRTVSIGLDLDMDGFDVWLFGTLNGDASSMSGEGAGKGTFTFQVERVVVRPGANASTKSN